MAEQLDFEAIVDTRTEVIPIEQFYAIPPFPGHRDSEGRARKAWHLHKFVPEHALDVICAEYLDAANVIRLCKITGNTRAEVWRSGLSDFVPTHVRITIYTYTTEEEVRKAGTRFDSPDAAWKACDFVFRAQAMTFGDEYKPVSKDGKSGKLHRAVRMADSFAAGLHNLGRSTLHRMEEILPHWAREFIKLDEIGQIPLMVDGTFSTGALAACILLYRFEQADRVDDFLAAVRSDEGLKDVHGMDGVMMAVEMVKRRARGTKGRTTHMLEMQDARKMLSAYDCHVRGERGRMPAFKVHPIDYCKQKMKQRQKEEMLRAAKSDVITPVHPEVVGSGIRRAFGPARMPGGLRPN